MRRISIAALIAFPLVLCAGVVTAAEKDTSAVDVPVVGAPASATSAESNVTDTEGTARGNEAERSDTDEANDKDD